MASLEAFDVDIVQPDGVLTYDLDDTFFALFEHSLLDQGKLTTTIQIRKTSTNVQLQFGIVGQVVLTCDRSLEPFDYPIHIEREVNFKLGFENKELDVDLYVIKQHTAIINIAQHLYDFISLAIPMKKIHSQFGTEYAEVSEPS